MEKKKAADQTPNNDKKQALDTAIRQIEKNFGKGAVMRLGDRPDLQVDAIPTGSLALDAALGIGGVPKGRIIEIYGPESSGKTTVALHIVAEVQKTGGTAAFIDAEHALDPVYAKALGVDIDDLLVSQPDSGDDALEICEAACVSVFFLRRSSFFCSFKNRSRISAAVASSVILSENTSSASSLSMRSTSMKI
jgi:RecA/RadA recombinase